MIIGGFQKLTLIDYPGNLATTVFTVGCSFRCPFCHNPELVIGSRMVAESKMEEDFFKHLKNRKGKIEGVCVTGGEPTVQKDIVEFIQKIKKLGFKVKLDTNGTRPDVLKKLLDLKLLNFIAMDIKNQPKKYDLTTGVKGPASTRGGDRLSTRGGDIKRIKLSVDLIMNSKLPYELRTTVVPGLHTEKDFEVIAKWIKGAKSYYLQEYREKIILDPKLKKKTKNKKIDLDKIKKNIENNFKKMGIRR